MDCAWIVSPGSNIVVLTKMCVFTRGQLEPRAAQGAGGTGGGDKEGPAGPQAHSMHGHVGA